MSEKNEIDIFNDTDGTVIMLTWPVLYLIIAGCLHRRALARTENILGTLGGDLVRNIARMAYAISLRENSPRLFQVFGRRVQQWFATAGPHASRLHMNVLQTEVLLRNNENEVLFEVLFEDGDLTVTVSPHEFISPFLHCTGGRTLTYHSLGGEAFEGIENPIHNATFCAMFTEFPRDAARIRRLIEAIIPDLNRLEPPGPHSFPAVARDLRRRHVAAGLNATTTTRRLQIRGDGFGITLNYNEDEDTIDFCLCPAEVFEEYMKEDAKEEGETETTFTMTDPDDKDAQYSGFLRRRTNTATSRRMDPRPTLTSLPPIHRFDLRDEAIDEETMGFLENAVDSAVKVGMLHSSLISRASRPVQANPTCHHCGVEVGAGGMADAPCTACAQRGLGPA